MAETELQSAHSTPIRDAFKKYGLNSLLLDFGYPVKMPEDMDPGKKYEVKLRFKQTIPELGNDGPLVEDIEDDGLSKYDPGWKSGTPPFDSRFPHQNQLPNCERNYIDYHRCKKIKGEDYEHCNYFKYVYLHKCPQYMYKEWDDQIENGTYRHKI